MTSIRENNETETFKGEISDKEFHNNKVLQQNLQIVHNENEYPCNVCGKTFTGARNLKNHINNIHNNLKDHKCDICGKSFSRVNVLKKHNGEVHNANPKNHKCDSCGKLFLVHIP